MLFGRFGWFLIYFPEIPTLRFPPPPPHTMDWFHEMSSSEVFRLAVRQYQPKHSLLLEFFVSDGNVTSRCVGAKKDSSPDRKKVLMILEIPPLRNYSSSDIIEHVNRGSCYKIQLGRAIEFAKSTGLNWFINSLYLKELKDDPILRPLFEGHINVF